jgi:hypothetical protein
MEPKSASLCTLEKKDSVIKDAEINTDNTTEIFPIKIVSKEVSLK